MGGTFSSETLEKEESIILADMQVNTIAGQHKKNKITSAAAIVSLLLWRSGQPHGHSGSSTRCFRGAWRTRESWIETKSGNCSNYQADARFVIPFLNITHLNAGGRYESRR